MIRRQWQSACSFLHGVLVLDAVDILKKVKAKYLSLKTYSDEGTETTPGQPALEFKTWFVSPKKFRFEWGDAASADSVENSVQAAVWSDGVTCHEQFLESRRANTVEDSIAACAGMSGGSILMVLNLLMPGVVQVNKFWLDMKNPVLKDSCTVNGFDCHYIVGDSESAGDTEVWIACDSLLVQRINEKMIISTEQAQSIRAEAVIALEAMGVVADSPVMKEALAGFPVKEYTFVKSFSFKNIVVDAPIAENIFAP